MGIRTFEEWAAPKVQTQPLNALKDAVVGIEAAYYLQHMLATPPSKEPLLSALGGFPFALKSHIENDLESMQLAGFKPLFVFSGLDVGKRDHSGRKEAAATAANLRGWELYDQHQPVKAVETFGDSGSIKPECLYRFVQRILRENKIEFMVAPYSACAQLAYLERASTQFIDAVMGSSELFLFDVDKVITKLDLDQSTFSWLSRRVCQIEIAKLPSDDVFIDACMLSGNSFLPTFPPLENPQIYRKPFTIRDTINMMLTVGPSVTAVCTHYQDEMQVQHLNYLDRYQRGRSAVKHHVVLTEDGKVEPLHAEQAPSDVHEFIGQRLPEELYFYLSKGVVGPRVLNWLTSGELSETPPLDGGESTEYHRLVMTQLSPMRLEALSLLSQPMSRFYHRKDVTARFWFDGNLTKVLSHKDLAPPPRDSVVKWNVRAAALDARAVQMKDGSRPGSLRFTVASLVDTSFAASTVSAKDVKKPLVTKTELLSNVVFRFAHLRGYTASDHTLTAWGKILHTALASLSAADRDLEEAVFLAIELLRLGLLNANNLFAGYIGAPLRGSDKDKTACLLVSRVACLAKLRHKPIGFTGPLSRNLLAHHAFISSLRSTLRDLVEIILVNLLLNGDADRNRDDWTDLGLGLPFIDDNDCGLGIAVKSYLDELATADGETTVTETLKTEVKRKGQEEWFPHSVDLAGDLDKAFRLWDAIFQAVKAAGKEVKEGEQWTEINEWLASRR